METKRIEHLNKIELQGNVGRCSIRTDNNVKSANFAIAVNYEYADADGNKIIETNWFSCVAFEGKNVSAEDLDKLTKMSTPVNVKGRIRAKGYYSKDGSRHVTYEVFVNELKIL